MIAVKIIILSHTGIKRSVISATFQYCKHRVKTLSVAREGQGSLSFAFNDSQLGLLLSYCPKDRHLS